MSEEPPGAVGTVVFRSILFDPIDPPDGGAGLSAAELALWAGRCPWCNMMAAFSPSQENGGVLTCRRCGVKIEGPERDQLGAGVFTREVTALREEGDPGMRVAATADSLPEVSV